MFNSSIVKRTMGAVALTGAVIGVPLGLSTGTASAASGDWDAVAACESSGNWGADTGNGFSGGLQFTDSTWAANGGSGSPSNASREEQIRVAENVLATQGRRLAGLRTVPLIRTPHLPERCAQHDCAQGARALHGIVPTPPRSVSPPFTREPLHKLVVIPAT